MTRERMQALRYSKDDTEAVTSLVNLHLRFHTYRLGWSDAAVRRFVRDAGPLLPELIELTRCDCTTRNQRKAQTLSRRMDELEARIVELDAEAEMKALRPDLDGQAVMDRLGRAPGSRRRARPWPSSSSCASRRAPSARTRPAAASTPGGPTSSSPRPDPTPASFVRELPSPAQLRTTSVTQVGGGAGGGVP